MTQGVWQTCCRCKATMWLPQELEDAAQRGREKIYFYCAYGHSQSYVTGETEADKLRRERDRLAQQIAQRDDEIKRQRERRQTTERQLAAQKANVTKLKKRAGAGVCPCCNRTFSGLQRHMAAKHPEFACEAA